MISEASWPCAISRRCHDIYDKNHIRGFLDWQGQGFVTIAARTGDEDDDREGISSVAGMVPREINIKPIPRLGAVHHTAGDSRRTEVEGDHLGASAVIFRSGFEDPSNENVSNIHYRLSSITIRCVDKNSSRYTLYY